MWPIQAYNISIIKTRFILLNIQHCHLQNEPGNTFTGFCCTPKYNIKKYPEDVYYYAAGNDYFSHIHPTHSFSTTPATTTTDTTTTVHNKLINHIQTPQKVQDIILVDSYYKFLSILLKMKKKYDGFFWLTNHSIANLKMRHLYNNMFTYKNK